MLKQPSLKLLGLAKRITLLSVSALILSSCASQSYKESSSSRDYGYQDAALEEGRYRITYRGKGIDTVYDFALLRAAEVTLLQGYDWFRVANSISEDKETNGYGSNVTLGTGYGIGRGRSQVGLGVGFPFGNHEETIVYSFDILLGKGEQPEAEGEIYNAASVQATIGPRAKEG